MKGLLKILNLFDLLYYVCDRITRKNFPSGVIGREMASGTELFLTLAVIFFFLGVFSIDVGIIFADSWRFYVAFLIIVVMIIDNSLIHYHLSRQKYVMTKYKHITSMWKCILFYALYNVVVIILVILSGMFWNYRIHGHI